MAKPSLIVGLGGTGDWVLTYLKYKLQTAFGRVPDEIHLRLLDTISATDRENALERGGVYTQTGAHGRKHQEQVARIGDAYLSGAEYIPMVSRPGDDFLEKAKRIRDNPKDYGHLQWFQAGYYLQTVPPAQFNLTDGAGQWRQFGRMAAFQVSEQPSEGVPGMLRTSLQQLRKGDSKINVFLVGSLAGGTGAGAFVDVAMLARRAEAATNSTVFIVGMLVLPGTFKHVLDEDVNTARAYAAFFEILRFQSTFGRNDASPFVIKYGPGFEHAQDRSLFDGVYLLDGERERNSLSNFRPEHGLHPSVADGLQLFLDEASGQKLAERTCNLTAEHASASEERDAKGLPPIFSSFGTYKLILPARLYAEKFSWQVVRQYLAHLGQARLSPKWQFESLADHVPARPNEPLDPTENAIALLRDCHDMFGEFTDRLPGQDAAGEIESYAASATAQRLATRLLAPSELRQDQIAPLREQLYRDIFSGVRDGGETGKSARTANAEIRTSCEQQMRKYLGEKGQPGQYAGALAQLVQPMQEEVLRAVNEKLSSVLSGGNAPAERMGRLGYARRIVDGLKEVVAQLRTDVLDKIDAAIDVSKGTEATCEAELKKADAQMEERQDYDSFNPFSSKHKKLAHEAQRAYLRSYGKLLRRRQLAGVVGAIKGLVETVADALAAWSAELEAWAQLLFTDGDRSALANCSAGIESADNDLRRVGKSHTSAIGLGIWKGGDEVDTTMGGYEHDLSRKFGVVDDPVKVLNPLAEISGSWIEGTTWSVDVSNPMRPSVGIAIEAKQIDDEAVETTTRLDPARASAGSTLHDAAFSSIWPRMGNESILSYLADLEASHVAKKLVDQVSPMLRASGGSNDCYLLYDQVDEHDQWVDQLVQELGQYSHQGVKKPEKLEAFDDRHTLTFSIIRNKITAKTIDQLKDYRSDYFKSLSKTDQHLRYHNFICEQKAAETARTYWETQGKPVSSVMTPLVYRLLEHPDRVALFFDGLIQDRIWPKPHSIDVVWLVFQGPIPEPTDLGEVVGNPANFNAILVARQDKPNLLAAMDAFVFKGEDIDRSNNKVDYSLFKNRIRGDVAALQAKKGDAYIDEMLKLLESWLEEVRSEQYVEKRMSHYIDNQGAINSMKMLFEVHLIKGIEEWKGKRL